MLSKSKPLVGSSNTSRSFPQDVYKRQLLSLGGTASYLVFFADPDGWAKTMLGNGTEQSYIDTMRNTGTTWILVIMLAGTILAAAVSAFIGCKMMKKQFEKAGITK